MHRFVNSLLQVLFFVAIVAVPAAFGQLTEIENKLPKNVPLKVEFKNYDKENWWHDLEIKVTNTGNKPIYYLGLTLWFNSTYPESLGRWPAGTRLVISFDFGDIRKFYSTDDKYIATPDDLAIRPNESYTFKVPDNSVKGWDFLKESSDFRHPHRGELEHSFTSFGDGTGILKGGTPFSQKKNDIRFPF